MKAVILAGGLGTRLKPLTDLMPKPLLPIGESSVLEIQIKNLKKHGFKEIFVTTNYMADYVISFLGDGKKYGVKLTFSKEDRPLGTYGPVILLRDRLKKPFLLMNGDILTNINFRKLYNSALKNNAILTAVTKKISIPFEFGKIVSKGKHIINIEEKPDFKPEILAGIYVIKPSIFKLIPINGYFGIDLLIQEMLSKKLKIAKYPINDYWLDVGRTSDYNKAQVDYHKYFGHLKNDKK